jgi:hypothetical protein
MKMDDPGEKIDGSATEKAAVEDHGDEIEHMEESGPVRQQHPAVVSLRRPIASVVVLIDDSEQDNPSEITSAEENEDETIEPASDNVAERHSAVVSPIRPSTPVVVLIDDSEGDNPQEASAPQSQNSPAMEEPAQQDTFVREESFSNQRSVAFISRKRRRRVALVKEDAQDRLLLPPNQYETILRRRAIRKRDDELKANASPTSSGKRLSLFGKQAESDKQEQPLNDDVVEEYDEEYGDISVGMKLNM